MGLIVPNIFLGIETTKVIAEKFFGLILISPCDEYCHKN